ncbi:MAG: PAS domain-containing protein [Sphingomicrobium sp.]
MKHSSIVNAAVPLELSHSWPLFEQPRHFELGCILNSAAIDAIVPARVGEVGLQHAGVWECDLSDNSLIWSGGVYDIFGLARGSTVTRDEAVSLYCEHSRAAMERLRAHAIKHKRGFTIDVEIRPASGNNRWMRLIAAPLCDGDQAVRLHGLKLAL